MGCDIHMYAEVKKDGKWNKVGDVFKNIWYSEDRELTKWNKPLTDKPYDGRNYDLFAILADVRNGYGFAGCITGERFNPISEPKGLPKDISKEIKKESDEWDCDGHSHSHFTIKELLDYDWKQEHITIGCITEEQYLDMKNNNIRPTCWSGDVCGGNIVLLDETNGEKLIEGKYKKEENKSYYIRTKFPKEKYEDCCGSFLEDTIPQLRKFGSDEDVRIVFWFDN